MPRSKPKPIRSVAGIRNLPTPKTGQPEHSVDTQPGLYVRVSRSGRKSFTVYYWLHGKQRRDTIGRFVEKAKEGEIGSLKWACTQAEHIRSLVGNGIDPREERKAEKEAAERQRAHTYKAVVEDYHRRYLVGEAGNASADVVRDILNKEGAAWRDRQINTIDGRDIGALGECIRDSGRPYLANRVHAYLRTFFDWCARPNVGYVEHSPCEGLKKPFQDEETRDRVFTGEELASLWHAARSLGVYEGAYLRVLLLTGKRKSALSAMRQAEIGKDGWWRPPQPKTRRKKTKKTNLPIPLPAPALRIVRNLPRVDENPFVFAGRRKNGHLDPGSPLQRKVQVASGVEDFFWHGIRHTVVTKLSELRVPGNAARRFTDHAQVKDAHEGYTHDELEDVTHDAAETWGRYVLLIAHRRIWRRVSAHLNAEDVTENDARGEIRRARRREFCNLIQEGGEPWTRWVRRTTRPTTPEPKPSNVIELNTQEAG